MVFEILSGYNPLPERRVKEVALVEGSDGGVVVHGHGSRGKTGPHGASQGKPSGALKGGAR